ncbi:MAG: hypothetical protein CVV27_15065 [Candidatus Melainabacteria bacterium HGW-Melainabacteria-1]|nr:MAG: hypothetical protein CVV27_15065 [Candidatus Melainabacteria bacterium HGW-Melainabacteria-1]
MAYPEPDHQIPCIIENGIVYGMKDIYRIVRDMGHVRYSEIVNHEVVSRGEGYIMSVVANQQSATIIANQRLYLNVCGFEYMRISSQDDGNVHFDLVHPYRTLRLTPVPDAGGEEALENKTQRYEDYDPFEQEDYAEIQLDDDDETMDGD